MNQLTPEEKQFIQFIREQSPVVVVTLFDVAMLVRQGVLDANDHEDIKTVYDSLLKMNQKLDPRELNLCIEADGGVSAVI